MGKKGSNPGPPKGTKARTVYPASHLTEIFNEWSRRYAENPEEWGAILDENGKPFDDYGENCAAYFQKLSDEIYNS